MYKHILLPVDGSTLAEDAALAGLALARAVGARVTAFHVVPNPGTVGLDAWAHARNDFAEKLTETLESRGALYLEEVRDTARRLGVPCDCQMSYGLSPHAGILKEARERGCDLIVMASHGRGEETDDILGSETVKVMSLGETPVLVHHARRDRHGSARA
ncbi:MAG TPA: universal stress protein [Usitatibacter sp.]|nr:universal stress protein [Usitatibacter sp.]